MISRRKMRVATWKDVHKSERKKTVPWMIEIMNGPFSRLQRMRLNFVQHNLSGIVFPKLNTFSSLESVKDALWNNTNWSLITIQLHTHMTFEHHELTDVISGTHHRSTSLSSSAVSFGRIFEMIGCSSTTVAYPEESPTHTSDVCSELKERNVIGAGLCKHKQFDKFTPKVRTSIKESV